MTVQTRLFGNIEIEEKKIIDFSNGIIGFDNLKKFMIIHDSETVNAKILWLQSLDEASVALPVIDPLLIKEDYNPTVEDELFKNIGEIIEDEMLVLTTLTVPSDLTAITTNLKAPIIINPVTMKGCQIIVENEEYPVKYPIYEILKAHKEAAKEGN
ncbi:MAG: flagellar assembly protein FliW [Lachnospiraceae bacterium]|nr:flagellar assembly protein FliW [Lachnospiraceae bacterium]